MEMPAPLRIATSGRCVVSLLMRRAYARAAADGERVSPDGQR
ncbi:hypothetical protein SMALA_6089 [Streptomyces malaysiensis subsp. malaysiensis]|nr:hypothetical protein SMALA_6089 [Streptomyces malaysiensis]